LALGAFVLGTSENGMAGVLPAIGAGLRVSAGAAGLLVTAYAVAVAVAGPVLVGLLRRVGHRRVLVGALLAMAAGNAATGAATWYPAAVAARAATGAAAAVYAVTALGAAATLSGPGRQSRAVAVVFGGVTVASVLGVPAGMVAAGWFGWRAVYLTLAVAALAVIPPLLTTLPAMVSGRAGSNTTPTSADGAGGWVSGRVVVLFVVNALVQAGTYAVSTYLVVLAGREAGLRGAGAGALVLVAGVAGLGGMVLGGRVPDAAARRAMLVAVAVLAVVLGVLPAVMGNAVLLAAAAAGWSVAFGVFCTAAQVCVGLESGGAGGVAGAVNISASNVGIAIGSAVGGAALRVAGTAGPGLAGAALTATALATAATLAVHRRATR
jgi:DHA1 family inner membrane transport protein